MSHKVNAHEIVTRGYRTYGYIPGASSNCWNMRRRLL
jgi:hypothetical protein